MRAARSGFVDVPGGRLRYEVAGEGPAVTFIHPGLWDMRTWDRQMETFPAAGFRAIRYDLRGYGESSRPNDEPYSHVRDLVAVLDALGADQTALVGCSVGGGIAIDVTLEHPDRIWALVAVAPGLGGFEPLAEEEEWWADLGAAIDEAVELGDLERAQDLRLAVWAPLGTDDGPGRRIREIAFDNLHELTMDESGSEELDPPAARRLGEIDLPTLVVAPDHDPAYMLRLADLIVGGALDARKVVLEDADHVANLRQPDRFDDAVLAFLAGCVPGAGTPDDP
jgi:pimeloyl-ACP methyl ester carboxylesterase